MIIGPVPISKTCCRHAHRYILVAVMHQPCAELCIPMCWSLLLLEQLDNVRCGHQWPVTYLDLE